ncbi:DoxX family protein [Piscibacillus halophilus]|uniref:DoxX family protein n=1 Tax=Piscibacillus halophilus TaxID=571933 RepID=UPI002409AD01|nr:DoxX family protein [Piscibacillus halophilus]
MVKISTTQLVRYLVGFIFIVSGLMKVVGGGLGAYFTNLGFPSPITFMYIVAATEIVFGLLIILNRYVKLSTIPLMVIIIGAIVITKLPMLHEGLINTLFHARLDIVTLGLLFLLYQQYDGKLFRP